MTATHPLVAQLTDLRRAAGIDRAVVAARIGVRAQHLQMWENGSYEPGLTKLTDWAEGLGCAVAVHPRAGIPLFGYPVDVLAELRRRRGVRQSDLAAQAGVTQPQLSLWERRIHAPGLSAVTVWADALGCDLMLVPSAVLAVAA